ncbi:MAG: tetratricopeptide repeat protein [Alphaproteobacteria bacterium]
MTGRLPGPDAQSLARVQSLLNQGQLEPAAEILRCMIARDARSAIAQSLLGAVLGQQGRHVEAIEHLRKAVALNPGEPYAQSNLAGALYAIGEYDAAIEAARQALRSAPKFVPALCNLGQSCLMAGRISEARDALERARQIEPNSPFLSTPSARLHTELGDHQTAIAMHRKATASNPTDPIAHSLLLCAMNYSDAVTQKDIFETALKTPLRRSNPPAPRGPATASEAHRKLRVGFVSPDLRRHSVGYFLLPLIEHLDRRKVSAICYSDTLQPDTMTEKFRAVADEWRASGQLRGEALAQQIRADRIDILVDLCGHWVHNRLAVFAQRPAPLQISWLGYPNTTGLSTIDYRITDEIADPPGDGDALHTETLLRIPAPFVCYGGSMPTPDTAPPPCLRKGAVTFGSFNNLAKLSDSTLRLWARILQAVPGSGLLLKSGGAGDAEVQRSFGRRLAGHGIDPARIQWLAWRGTTEEHLSAYANMDVALDPFPYNGTTTTCEALWMGVPVVTLRGDRHAGRVSASLLSAAGFPEWVATTEAQYVETAVRLAADTAGLAALRQSLRARMTASALRDGAGFARRFQAALRTVWANHCAGLPATRN